MVGSYDLLDEDERNLFGRLSVFAGGSTLEAIEEICDPEEELDSFWCEMSIRARFARRWNQKGSKTLPKSLHKAAITPKIGFPPLLYGYASEFRTRN